MATLKISTETPPPEAATTRGPELPRWDVPSHGQHPPFSSPALDLQNRIEAALAPPASKAQQIARFSGLVAVALALAGLSLIFWVTLARWLF